MKRVTQADVTAILPLFQNEADNYLATGTRRIERSEILTWVEAEEKDLFILYEREKVAAYGEIWVDETEGTLEFAHLLVAPQFRLAGFGKRLLEGLLVEAKKYPYDEIFLRVLPENKAVLDFFRQFGFVVHTPLFEGSIWMKRKNLK
ncbi:GNAT family N-acetyltransferase [Listeria valentina]|uniref:GNAT family N-acetyltransferase n=1 Tax=Listeria valentina TaxID=2705293 RepID=UPI001431BAEA|nr:GNAT family N-acetyltransferase [Listeria valentina]